MSAPVDCSATKALGSHKYVRTQSQPENPFVALIPDQQIAIVPEFTLESGVILRNVPVAYTTRGTLSPSGDNAMVICHALTGSADVGDWWGHLVGGPGKAFDASRFFIICMNSLGSPYGTASPVTSKDNDVSKGRYGPEFPLTTIRDDVRLHKMLLDDLGVRQVAAVIGGSLGGMLALEWAYFGREYIRCVVPIATCSRHSAWGISWGEAQRQSIFGDPKYDDGYYSFDDPPSTGLAAARMSALLTYRSRDSFDSRFGRNISDAPKRQTTTQNHARSNTPGDAHFHIHNEGHQIKTTPSSRDGSTGPNTPVPPVQAKFLAPNKSSIDAATAEVNAIVAAAPEELIPSADPQFHGPERASATASESLTGGDASTPPTNTYFSAQSYLRYQGQKFVKRFDTNCYIAMTRKLDTHDISRGRADTMAEALALIEQPTLVLGIESDGLFTFAEQQELAAHIPNARLERIDSPEGHDAFLLQFEQVNHYVLSFLKVVLPDIMSKKGTVAEEEETGKATKPGLFSEEDGDDITAW